MFVTLTKSREIGIHCRGLVQAMGAGLSLATNEDRSSVLKPQIAQRNLGSTNILDFGALRFQNASCALLLPKAHEIMPQFQHSECHNMTIHST